MKKLTKEEKAEVEYFKDKMRVVGLVAAAAVVEPQEDAVEHHTRMAGSLMAILTDGLDDKSKQLIEARIKAYALKVSRVKL